MSDDPARRAAPHPLGDFAAAIGFLTLVPIGRHWSGDVTPRATGWYPWVGWLLGGGAVAALWGAIRFAGHWPTGGAPLAGALVVAGWAGVTRLLHWDGLADSFDGLLGGSTPERRLEIMRDSRIGSFGATAILLVGLVQAAAISDVLAAAAWWPVLLAPVLGRLAAAAAAWQLPAARREGLGLTAVDPPGIYEVVVAAAAMAALGAAILAGAAPWHVGVGVGVGAAFGVVVPRILARGVGGMTGDLFGATVLLVETAVLVTGAALA